MIKGTEFTFCTFYLSIWFLFSYSSSISGNIGDNMQLRNTVVLLQVKRFEKAESVSCSVTVLSTISFNTSITILFRLVRKLIEVYHIMLIIECKNFSIENNLIYFERTVCFEKKSRVYCFTKFHFNRLAAHNYYYGAIYLFFFHYIFINRLFHSVPKIRINGHNKECRKTFTHLG